MAPLGLPGAEVPPGSVGPEGRLAVALYWRAAREPTADYRVFVHLLRPDGWIAAQHDGIPRDGARPTIGWAPGGFVEDVHLVELPGDLPAGAYRLIAGMYDADTGERLRAPDGGDVVALGAVTVAAR